MRLLNVSIVGLVAATTAPVVAQNSFGEATRNVAPPAQQQQDQGPAPRTSSQPAPGFGAPPPAQGAAGSANLDRLMQLERQDFGVQPPAQLHTGPMHGPTPTSIPGGQVVTTKGLLELLRGGQVPVLLLDVLGGQEMIQGAQYAIPAAQPGSFADPIQEQYGAYLQQATGGNKQYPIVVYCLSRECWLSYNASLRAIKLGYTNVLWYRGGIEAWQQAGQPLTRATGLQR